MATAVNQARRTHAAYKNATLIATDADRYIAVSTTTYYFAPTMNPFTGIAT